MGGLGVLVLTRAPRGGIWSWRWGRVHAGVVLRCIFGAITVTTTATTTITNTTTTRFPTHLRGDPRFVHTHGGLTTSTFFRCTPRLPKPAWTWHYQFRSRIPGLDLELGCFEVDIALSPHLFLRYCDRGLIRWMHTTRWKRASSSANAIDSSKTFPKYVVPSRLSRSRLRRFSY